MPSTDAATARATARRHTRRYLGLDNYRNNLKRLGWTDADLANDGSDDRTRLLWRLIAEAEALDLPAAGGAR